MSSLLDHVGASLRQLPVPQRGGPIAAAVSGGADSVVLLALLQELCAAERLQLLVLHIDHGLRPESGADAEFVQGLAQRFGLSCHVRALGMTAALGRSPETRARELRYEALHALCAEAGARVLATAHHQDDQVETILFRILRGTGLFGLRGIPEQRALRLGEPLLLWRPLLGVGRAALRAELAARGLPHREDPSNALRSTARNALRHELLPALRAQFGPGVDAHLLGLARAAEAVCQPLKQEARELAAAAVQRVGPGRLRVATPVAAPLREPLLRLALGQLDPRRFAAPAPRLLAECAELLAPSVAAGTRRGGRSGVLAERSRDGVLLQRLPMPPVPAPVPVACLPLAVRWELPPWELLVEEASASGPGTPWDARVDRDLCGEPLAVGAPRAGDRFWPQGAAGETSLARFLARHGVPRMDRDRVPVLRDGAGRILWLPGCAVSQLVRWSPATRRALRLRCAVPEA